MKILLATDGSRHSRSAVDLLKRTPFATAEEFGAELVVVGSRGLSGAKRFLLGSVSQKRFLLGSVSNRVTHHAKCSVWVVRRPNRTAPQD